MIKVGLTGNRFSGKSKIADAFKRISIPIFDADVVIKLIINYNYDIKDILINKFGSKYFKVDKDTHKINLSKINKEYKFGKVLDIIEKDLFNAYEKFEAKNKDSIYTIFMSSFLYEKRWDKKMDQSITVYAPFTQRIERGKKVLKHNFHDYMTLNYMLSSEMDELKKNSKSKFVIHNYNEFNIKTQVSKIDNSIIKDYILKKQTL